MTAFAFKAARADGGVVQGMREAASRAEIVAALYAQGLTPIRVDATATVPVKRRMPRIRRKRMTAAQLATTTRELGTLLRASVPLDRALGIIVSLEDGSAAAHAVNDIRSRVKQGLSFSDAVEQEGKPFSRFYVSMLKAGESGGALDSVLDRLAEYLEEAKEVRDTLVSALIYPAILVIVALTSILVLLGYVVPQFTEMFASVGEALPWPTRLTIAAGEIVRSYGWAAALLVGAGALGVRRYLQVPTNLDRFHATLLRLPLVGELLVKSEVAQFARTLATLLQNGVGLLKALGIVRGTMSNRALAAGIERVAASLKEGQSLADPLAKQSAFPPFAIQMIRVGEESGSLPTMLMHVAVAYDRETRMTMKRGLALLEPALIVTLGFVIAGVIVSILLAVLSMNELVV